MSSGRSRAGLGSRLMALPEPGTLGRSGGHAAADGHPGAAAAVSARIGTVCRVGARRGLSGNQLAINMQALIYRRLIVSGKELASTRYRHRGLINRNPAQ